MKSVRTAAVVLLAVATVAVAGQRFDLMRVDVTNSEDVQALERAGCIVNGPGPDGRWLVEVPADKAAELERDGRQLELWIPDIREYYRDNAQDARYHSYTEMKDSLMLLAANNPAICRFETLGYCSRDSLLFALRISNNVGVEEDEPEVFFEGNIHGDEKTGSEALYAFAHELVEGYGSNPDITEWIDTYEIWLEPINNPDGHIRGRRSNANGVDCNRNYGYNWDDWCGTGAPFSQPETRAHMELSLRNNFTHWTSYHSGVAFISIPWSYTAIPPPDYDEIYYLAQRWQSHTGYTIGRLYQIHGPSKDYAYGAHGGIGWTVESCALKTPPADSLDPIIARESAAMKEMLAHFDQGVRGIVTDSVSGLPIKARMSPMPNNVPSFCDTPGDYHRYLRPGTYDLVFSLNGYTTKTVAGVTVGADSATRVDVVLAPDSTQPVSLHRVAVCNVQDEEVIAVTIDRAYGLHDGVRASLGRGGWGVFDFGTLVYNLSGNDFTVYEDDGDPEGYDIYAGSNWDGPWSHLGSGTGTQGFDLATGGLSFCRYVRVVDDNSSSSGPTAGFDLDAIEAVVSSAAAVVLHDRTVIDSPPGGNNDGKLDPGETADLVAALKNVGRVAAGSVTGVLSTADSFVAVLDSAGTFGTIEPDSIRDNDGDRFQLYADPMCPREHSALMKLRLTGTDYEDSLEFFLVVGELRAVDPIPDGPRQPALYWAYDDVDSGYAQAPQFGWVEVSGTGTELDLSDDDIETVNLPSGFGPWRYYGQQYTQLSVCGNGFVAPGQSSYTAWTNAPLPSGAAPPMVAMNWDDLYPPEGGGVWYYHDAANHRFVVEWDSVAYYSPRDARDKYELVIYDTTVASPTGDNVLVAQYLTANNYVSNTVGIQDPGASIAIQCLFNGDYHRGAAPLAAGRAIKYTTSDPTGLAEETCVPVGIGDAVRVSPNPSRGRVALTVRLTRAGPASVQVFDATGRLVRTLMDSGSKALAPGSYPLQWDGRDGRGNRTARGVYLVRLDSPDGSRQEKVVRLD